MNSRIFLLLNLALSFYLDGAIWALEVDIFRSWRLVDAKDFHRIQSAHWKKLPYWVFVPVGFALAGSIALVFYHPAQSQKWVIWGNLAAQLLSHLLTALFWGRLQGKLSRDERGPASPYLSRFLATHWIRTLLINTSSAILLAWAIQRIGVNPSVQPAMIARAANKHLPHRRPPWINNCIGLQLHWLAEP